MNMCEWYMTCFVWGLKQHYTTLTGNEHYVRGNLWVYELTPGTVDHFIIKAKHLIDGMWARCPLAPQWPWMLLLTSHSHIYVYLIQLLEYCLDINVHQSKYRSLFLILKCQRWVPFYACSISAQQTPWGQENWGWGMPHDSACSCDWLLPGLELCWVCYRYMTHAYCIELILTALSGGQPRQFILEKIGPDNLSQRRLVFAQ